MRKLLILGIATILSISLNAITYVKSNINSVTVFTSGAQISRKANVSLPIGETELKFTNLSPFIDAQSIQVKCNSKITILSVNQKSDYLNKNQESKELTAMKKRMDNLDIQKKEKAATLQNVNDQLSFLDANKYIGGKNQELNLINLKATDNYYKERNLSLRKQRIFLDKSIKNIDDSINALKNQIQQFASKQKDEASNEIIVKVNAAESTNCLFELTYVVSNAGWYPSYDIRANDVNEPIELIYKANIHQNTKEYWNNVKLTLSTADPYIGNSLPTQSPYIIKERPILYENNNILKMATPTRKLKSSLKYETFSEANSLDSTVIEEDQAVAPEVSQSNNQTTAEFEIKTPYSIPSDNNEVIINIQNYSMPVIYEYYCIPKKDKDAFLTAQITDWGKLNLTTGEANLFFDNTFVGKSILNSQQISDTLKLSFGRDKNINIKRELIKSYNEKKLLGSKRTETKGWQINIRNRKSNDINIKVYDQIPISQSSDIEIDALDISNGNLNKETGEVMWNLNIKSQEKKTLNLKYQVKYPKNKNLSIE